MRPGLLQRTSWSTVTLSPAHLKERPGLGLLRVTRQLRNTGGCRGRLPETGQPSQRGRKPPQASSCTARRQRGGAARAEAHLAARPPGRCSSALGLLRPASSGTQQGPQEHLLVVLQGASARSGLASEGPHHVAGKGQMPPDHSSKGNAMGGVVAWWWSACLA